MAAVPTPKDNVRVCCRFRPVNKIEKKQKGHKIVARVGNDSKSVTIGGGKKQKNFNLDYVFPPNSNQETVFNYTGLPLIDNVMAGYNCTLFAYGQTGSGKTYSMEGIINDPVNEGIIPRMVRTLFDRILNDNSVEFEYTLRVSYVEIYNEKLRDLLQPNGPTLKIRDNTKSGARGVYIENVFAPFVASPEEVFEHLTNGHVNRSVASTRMNEHSSRSHAVFMLQLDARNTDTGSSKASKLMLVDLAGSEKVRKTNATGQTLKEAQQINKSLMVLGLVINSLVENKKHIPYRDSKLTRLLSDALGGNSKTCLIVTASPSKYNAEETVSTLRFGQRAKAIKNVAKVNQELSVREYKKLLEKAKKREEILRNQIHSLQSQNDQLLNICAKNNIDTSKLSSSLNVAHNKASNTTALVTMVPNTKNQNTQIQALQTKLEQISDEKSRLDELIAKKKEELEDVTQENNEFQNHVQDLIKENDDIKKRYEELHSAKKHLDKLFESLNSGQNANISRYNTEKLQWEEDKISYMDDIRVKDNTIQELKIKLQTMDKKYKDILTKNNNNKSNTSSSSISTENSDDLQRQLANEGNTKTNKNKKNNNNINYDKQKMIALVDTARKYRSQNEKNSEEIKKLREKLKAYKRRDEVNKQLRDNWNKQLNQMEQAVLLANEIYNRERTRHEAEMAEKDVEILKLRKFLLSFTNRHAKSHKSMNNKRTINGHNNNKIKSNRLGVNDANAPGARKSKIVKPKVIKAGGAPIGTAGNMHAIRKQRSFNRNSIKRNSIKRNSIKKKRNSSPSPSPSPNPHNSDQKSNI